MGHCQPLTLCNRKKERVYDCIRTALGDRTLRLWPFSLSACPPEPAARLSASDRHGPVFPFARTAFIDTGSVAFHLERYLALSAEAGTEAVVLLTKADTSQDAEAYCDKAARLQRGLPVLALDARDQGIAARLADWCRPGQTVALLGSSGVGKTTLTYTLIGLAGAMQAIRADDAQQSCREGPL